MIEAAPHRPPLKSVVLLGPSLTAVSGVSTHLNQLFGSRLAQDFQLLHFQVGSEGRDERAWQRLLRFVASPFAFMGFLLRREPGIVHINTSLEPKSYWRDIAYLVTGKLLRRKVVYQVHGGALPRDFFSRSRFLTRVLWHVLRLPDAVVLLSQEELRAYRNFVPAKNVQVIPNAIAAEEVLDDKPHVEPNEPLHVVYVGRLARDKGVFEVIAAAKLLADRGIAVRVSIAGSGPEMRSLKMHAMQAGMEQSIRFLGPLFGRQKAELWRDADVFAFPTHHREGLPYTVLESMAACVVPVVSPVGAISDVIQDGVHGIFVPSRDPAALARAIIRLHENREELRRMAIAGRERVRSGYSVARLAEDFHRLYQTLEA